MKVFYCILTSDFNWGKGLDLKSALKAAKVTNKKIQYVIHIGICKADTPPETLTNISKCFGVTQYGEVRFAGNCDEQDKKDVDNYFLGWSTDTSFTKPKKS